MAAAMRAAGVVLSHPVVSTTPSNGVSGEELYQPKVGEVAIERCSGPLASLLDGVSGKFKRQSTGVAYARLHALGQR